MTGVSLSISPGNRAELRVYQSKVPRTLVRKTPTKDLLPNSLPLGTLTHKTGEPLNKKGI